MTPDGAWLSEIVAAAVRSARVRAVVQAGWAGLSSVDDDVLLVGDRPHEWLFPRTALLVHHAGAGTTRGRRARRSSRGHRAGHAQSVVLGRAAAPARDRPTSSASA